MFCKDLGACAKNIASITVKVAIPYGWCDSIYILSNLYKLSFQIFSAISLASLIMPIKLITIINSHLINMTLNNT